MAVYKLNPIEDHRWHEFVQVHPNASVFHTVSWLETLRTTYGYDPVAFTTFAPGSAIRDGVVFCRVKSWITGTRLVSLPFADHCAPLCERPDDLYFLLDEITNELQRAGMDHVEIRPIHTDALDKHTALRPGKEYRLHLLDLEPTLQSLLGACDKSCVQRRLRHAERETLIHEEGTGPQLLRKFYGLLVLTRKRHGLPPQPIAWFRNMLSMFGNGARVRIVSCGDVPIASLLTLTHNKSVVYKYGCSDQRYNRHAGMVSLFWRAIRDAKESGMQLFDMGRSDLDNPGLIQFKSNWSARNLPLTYWRYPQSTHRGVGGWVMGKGLAESLLSRLPESVLIAAGNALYKHAG